MKDHLSRRGSRRDSRPRTKVPNVLHWQELTEYHGAMCTVCEPSTLVDIVLKVSIDMVHVSTVRSNDLVFQSPIAAINEIVWDHSEKSMHFVLTADATSPVFFFSVLTDLEAHFTAMLPLVDLERSPIQQIYVGVLIGHNLPSPIHQRRASFDLRQSTMLSTTKRRELLKREQPVRKAMSRERLGLEYMRSGCLCFTCSISGDQRGLKLDVQHLRVFPSPDCYDRSACLFIYSYEHLDTCEVMGTRLELRFHTTHDLAKQPSHLVFRSVESQYIREAIWYLKNGTYMDSTLRELLTTSPTRPSSPEHSHQTPVPLNFADVESLKQRIEACCRVIGCGHLVQSSDQSFSKSDEVSASNVMAHINSGELSHMNPSVCTNPSTSRVLANGLCELHASCLASASSEALSRQRSVLSRDKLLHSAKTVQPLLTLLQSPHYAKMFKFQGQILKRHKARTFHIRKMWQPKLMALWETPVGGFLCYYAKLTHCPGMTDTPSERRVIDLSSVICIRPVSVTSPVSRGNGASAPTMHAFDIVTLYRTWTFAAVELDEYEIWLHVLKECVEKHATMTPDRAQRFAVKLAMTDQSSSSEATSLEVSAYGVSFCTGHDAEVVLNSWYYTDLEKWSVVFQQGYMCCLLKCRSPVLSSPRSPRAHTSTCDDTVAQDYLFRTTEASEICFAIEFFVGKCMAKLEILVGQYVDERHRQHSATWLMDEPMASKAGPVKPNLRLHLTREQTAECASLTSIRSPERTATTVAAESHQDEARDATTASEIDRVPTHVEALADTDELVAPATTDDCLSDKPLIILTNSAPKSATRAPTPSTCSSAELAGAKHSLCKDEDLTTIGQVPSTMLKSTTCLDDKKRSSG